MSEYPTPSYLLRGISDDNASFVTADDSNPEKIQRDDALLLHTYQPRRMENVGYNTIDSYPYHDQNISHAGPNVGYPPTNYQYPACPQFASNVVPSPIDHRQFSTLSQYEHEEGYQFQQQKPAYNCSNSNTGKDNHEIHKGSASKNDSDCDEDSHLNSFGKGLQHKEKPHGAHHMVFKDDTLSEESPEQEDSGSDFDPRANCRKRKSNASKRVVIRKAQKRVVLTSDDESITDDKSNELAPKKVRNDSLERSETIPRPKARNYKLKTEEERQSDPYYKTKREKNNDAVRKSRKKSKEMEMRKNEEMDRLKKQNREMRNELTILKSVPCMRCGLLPLKNTRPG